MKPATKQILSGAALPVGLFVTFLVLRLTGVIAWSWWWVASPLLAPLALAAIMAAITACIYIRYRKL